MTIRPVRRARTLLAVTASLLALAGIVAATAALATSKALQPGEFVISGDVEQKLVLSTDDLVELPQRTMTVTFRSGGVPETHVETGPLLVDVLALAEPRFDPDVPNHRLRFFVEAIDSDLYAAIVAYGEIDPGFGNKPVLLSIEEDGQALVQPRLVVPGDIRGGRYVTDIINVILGEAPAHGPQH
jgi:hypothetical protein